MIARRLKRDMNLEKARDENQLRYSKQLSDIQDEIDHEKKQAKIRLDEAQREQAMVQAKQELEDLKKARTRAETRRLAEKRKAETTAAEAASNSRTPDAETRKKPKVQKSWESGSPEEEWQQEKDMRGADNDALDSLMKMIGLQEVKEQF